MRSIRIAGCVGCWLPWVTIESGSLIWGLGFYRFDLTSSCFAFIRCKYQHISACAEAILQAAVAGYAV
jgi:hypothetical protein